MFKNENGFSLVELAIAAGLAVALAATAVTILSGTTATLSSKANGAAGTSTTYNSDVLANASGAVSAPATPSSGITSAALTNGLTGSTSWAASKTILKIKDNGTYQYSKIAPESSYFMGTEITKAQLIENATSRGATVTGNVYTHVGFTLDFSDPYKLVVTEYGRSFDAYTVDANGDIVAW